MKQRPTQKTFDKQLKKFEKVTAELIKEGLPLTNKNLMNGLETQGLKVDADKLYYLKQAVNKNNNFVLAISQSQYSAMIQDIYDKIMIIEGECFELAKEDWTIHEVQTSDDADGHSYEKTIDNQHKPQSDFYRLALDCQTAKTKILSGDVINASVALIESNFNNLRNERDDYKKEAERLREKLEKQNATVHE
jgi:hypothetical protein